MTEETFNFEKYPLIARVEADGKLKIYPKTPGSDTKPPLYRCRLEHLLCITKDKGFYLDVLQVVKSVGNTPYDIDALKKYVEDGENWKAVEMIIPQIPKASLSESVKLHKFPRDLKLLEIIMYERNADKGCWIHWITSIDMLLDESKVQKPDDMLMKYVADDFDCQNDQNLCIGKLVEAFAQHFTSLREFTSGWILPTSAMAEQNTTVAIACFDKRCKKLFDVNGKMEIAMNLGGVKCSEGTYIMAALFYFYAYREECLNKFVQAFLDNDDTDVNLRDSGGNTAALYAAVLQKEAVFRMLVTHPKFDFNATNNTDETLEQCLKNNYVTIFNRTIDHVLKVASEKKLRHDKPDGGETRSIQELLSSVKSKISADDTLSEENKTELTNSVSDIMEKLEKCYSKE